MPKPPLELQTTTLWEYPSQDYGRIPHGDKDYVGATPAWIIWQLLQRYTRPGDVILDPMCGSGTTIDVATELERKPIGFDLAPSPARTDIKQNDARHLPLADASVDFAFLDPPYSTHVDYSDDPRCIGKLDANDSAKQQEEKAPRHKGTKALRDGPDALHQPLSASVPQCLSASSPPLNPYYHAMDQVICELHRVLKNRRYMALYVSDSFKKGQPFMPIGFDLFAIMRRQFKPVDIIAVVRHNKTLQRNHWHTAAIEGNYFLRGFNYLFIMKKELPSR